MSRFIFHHQEDLQSFIDRIDKHYYYEINALCDVAKKHANRLKELEVSGPTSSYVSLCIQLVKEIDSYISNKKEHLMPYIQSLFEKDKEGHDCRNCTGSGSCSMQHDMHIIELKQSHIQLKDILNRLQMVALPLYSESLYPDVYRVLRNNIALIENSLGELFLIEETELIPKVIDAQRNIHASD